MLKKAIMHRDFIDQIVNDIVNTPFLLQNPISKDE